MTPRSSPPVVLAALTAWLVGCAGAALPPRGETRTDAPSADCVVLPVDDDVSFAEQLYFEPGSDALSASTRQVIGAIAAVMVENPHLARISLHGHAADGEADVSLQRAEAVRAALVEAGVDPQRLSAFGHGRALPIAGGSSAEDRERNRRVELRIDERTRRAPPRERCRGEPAREHR